jgi:predicted nucleic acid-binding protein
VPQAADPTRARPPLASADANLFVALLAGPDHSDHMRALDLFRSVAEGRLGLLVTPVVIAEVAFVLWRRLGRDRATVAAQLSQLVAADGLVVVEQPIIERALEIHGTTGGLDFVDAYLAASAALIGPPTVASFDRDFDRIEGIRRIPS